MNRLNIFFSGILLFSFGIYANESNEIAKPTNVQKGRNELAEAWQKCLEACERVFLEILQKELEHVVRQMPKWICRIGLFRDVELSSEDFSCLIANACINIQHLDSSSLLAEYACCKNAAKKKEWVEALFLSEEKIIQVADELLYQWCLRMHNNDIQKADAYYNELFMTTSKDGCESIPFPH